MPSAARNARPRPTRVSSHRRTRVLTAFGPVPGELEPLDAPDSHAWRPRSARHRPHRPRRLGCFHSRLRHGLGFGQLLGLEAQSARPALGAEAQLERVLAGPQALFRGTADRLAVTLGYELDVSKTGRLETDGHRQSWRETLMSFNSAGMISAVGASALTACSTATGGGANSCESSGGGVSGTNCATDSFGRTVTECPPS